MLRHVLAWYEDCRTSNVHMKYTSRTIMQKRTNLFSFARGFDAVPRGFAQRMECMHQVTPLSFLRISLRADCSIESVSSESSNSLIVSLGPAGPQDFPFENHDSAAIPVT